jgi:fucose permease
MASRHGEGLMQWLHACFGIGVTLGPLIMTFGISRLGSWRPGYRLVGTAQLCLALFFALSARLWRRQPPRSAGGDRPLQQLMDYHTPLGSTLHQAGTWLSMLLFFLYTGLELSLGHWTYTLLSEGRGIDPQVAGLWAGSYWAMFTLGRFLAGLVAKKIGHHRLLSASLLLALVGAVLVLWNPISLASVIGVGLCGLAFAPVFPALVSGTVERVGVQHAANTIGIQISAAGLGAALMPALAGVLARRISLEVIPVFWLLLVVLLGGVYLFSQRRLHA